MLIVFSIVEFAVRDDMEYALKKLNDRELNGQRVTLREVKKFNIDLFSVHFLFIFIYFCRILVVVALLAVVALPPRPEVILLLVAVDVALLLSPDLVLLPVVVTVLLLSLVLVLVLVLSPDQDLLLARERSVMLLTAKIVAMPESNQSLEVDLALLLDLPPALLLDLLLNLLLDPLLVAREGKFLLFHYDSLCSYSYFSSPIRED